MPKLRRVSGKDAIKALEKLGFTQVPDNAAVMGYSKNKQKKLRSDCVVPLHENWRLELCVEF